MSEIDELAARTAVSSLSTGVRRSVLEDATARETSGAYAAMWARACYDYAEAIIAECERRAVGPQEKP